MTMRHHCGRRALLAGVDEFFRFADDIVGRQNQRDGQGVALWPPGLPRRRPRGRNARLGSNDIGLDRHSRSCSATMKRNSALVMTIGRAKM